MTTATPDYTAAIATAALFDTSAAGKLELTGPDAPAASSWPLEQAGVPQAGAVQEAALRLVGETALAEA